MKRSLSLLLIAILIFVLSSCKKDDFTVGEEIKCSNGTSFEMLIDSKSSTEKIKVNVNNFILTAVKKFDITKTDDTNNEQTYIDMYMYYVQLSGKIDKKSAGMEMTFNYSHNGENIDGTINDLICSINEDGSFSAEEIVNTSNRITEVSPLTFTFSY